jgi:hypothetical protein
MKPLKSILTATVAVLAFSSAAFALPPGKGGLTTRDQFSELKAGDKVTLVCKMHGTQKEMTIKDSKMAMELCKENTKTHCDTCKKDYKVIWTNPSGKTGGPKTTMTIVDENGKPCMEYIKAS